MRINKDEARNGAKVTKQSLLDVSLIVERLFQEHIVLQVDLGYSKVVGSLLKSLDRLEIIALRPTVHVRQNKIGLLVSQRLVCVDTRRDEVETKWRRHA